MNNSIIYPQSSRVLATYQRIRSKIHSFRFDTFRFTTISTRIGPNLWDDRNGVSQAVVGEDETQGCEENQLPWSFGTLARSMNRSLEKILENAESWDFWGPNNQWFYGKKYFDISLAGRLASKSELKKFKWLIILLKFTQPYILLKNCGQLFYQPKRCILWRVNPSKLPATFGSSFIPPGSQLMIRKAKHLETPIKSGYKGNGHPTWKGMGI